MTIQTKTIGRLPVYLGDYDNTRSYGKKNRVTLYGSEFESKHDNNNTAPATWDGAETITFNTTDWQVISNGTDAWIAGNDKPSSSEEFPYNGMGRVVLKKTMVEGENILTQDAFEDSEGNPLTNTIFVIQYDFALGEDITVPANCVLEFDGGSISGDGTGKDTIIGANTKLIADDYAQVFDNILLDGTFDCNHLSVCNFGVNTNTESDSYNTATFNNYIIPSCENTLVKLVIPNGIYYIDDSLVFSGKYDIECQGKFFYSDNGTVAKTAITIGDGNNYIGSYKIIITRNRINYQQSGNDYVIPESVGVKVINAKSSDIYIDSSNFAYCAVINSTNNKGCCYNKISVYGGGYCYNALMLSTDNGGWTNENYFNTVELYTFSTNVLNDENIGVYLKGDSTHPINNNVFMKPCYEGFHIGYKLYKAQYNCSFSDRIEGVSVPVEDGNQGLQNSFLIGFASSTTGYIPIGVATLTNVSKAANRKVLYDGKVSAMTLTGSGKTYLPLYTARFTSDTEGDPLVSVVASLTVVGFIVDTTKVKSLSISSNYLSRMHVMVLDNNNQKVALTDENVSTYFKYKGATYLSGGVLRGNANAYANTVVVTENTTRVFIGISYAADMTDIHLETYDNVDIAVAKSCIITPIEQKITTVPTSTSNAEIGKTIRYNDDAIMWTGAKWVILNQTPI